MVSCSGTGVVSCRANTLSQLLPGSLMNLFHLRWKKHRLPEDQAASSQFSCVPLHMTLVLLGNAPHTREQRATRCPFLSTTQRGPEVVMNYGGFSRLSTSLGQVEDSLRLAHCSQPAVSPLDCPDGLLTVMGLFF